MTEGTRVGRYVLLQSLAAGGMGEIWVARDEQLQRDVAIKLMRPGDDGGSRRLESFEREARMIARLQHPHVVQVYDYGIGPNDTPYIVMELLEGEDLSRVLKHTCPMSLAALVPWIVQAAKGLHAAHRAGIVHHDLKPANLLLARQGSEYSVKILDFGVATMRHVEPSLEWAGTPAYMSPEQLRRGLVGHRTDLWSLAVVAYEALTGVSPFSGPGLAATVDRILGEHPPPPSQQVESLGPDVDAFFERALAKEPGARFSSALEMAAAFSALHTTPHDEPSTILVVDDEPDLEKLIRQRFRRKIRCGQYELLFAADGQAALDQLARRPDVDVVLTDLNMPGMNGLTLLRRLSRAGPALRAVVLSAYGDMANIRAAMNAGAYDFLTKPIDFPDLEATLGKALRDAGELRRALRSIEENDALRMFVDDALVDRLLPLLRVSSEVGGDYIEATVVSAHLWGIGRTVEQEPASAVFERLNRAFDIIVPIINTWQGVVVRFLGDALLAVFQGDDHLARGASACFAARAALSEAAHGDELAASARACIGLDSGPVLSGSIGSQRVRRLDYTVLGAVVSQAMALERLAERSQILIRRELAERLAPLFDCRRIDRPPDAGFDAVYNLERQSILNPGRSDGREGLTATIPADK